MGCNSCLCCEYELSLPQAYLYSIKRLWSINILKLDTKINKQFTVMQLPQIQCMCAQYSIIFPLLLCTENILLDKKAFKSVYKLIILPWYRRCTWPAAWQCSGQQAAGTRHHRTASRYWYQSGGGAGRGNTSNTFIL